MLAGLEAGIFAACVMAAFFWVENVLLEQSAWHAPRLFAAALLDRVNVRAGFDGVTIAGYAFLLVLSGVQGLLFSAMVPPRAGFLWSANAGIIYSLLWHTFVLRPLVGRSHPYLLTGPLRSWVLLGYFIFGIALGFYPAFYRAIARPLARQEATGDK